MADFEFYRTAYCGSRIPEEEFPRCAARAQAALERLERTYVVTGGADSRRMAVCAMAEEIYSADNRLGVTARTVGSVSERYSQDKCTDQALCRALYRQAGVYLDIYRGLGTSH